MKTPTAAELAATSGYALGAALLLELDLAAPVYLNSTIYTLRDDLLEGREYLGAGTVGQVEAIRDGAGEFPQLKMTLSGVPDSHIALADNADTAGKSMRIKFALIDAASGRVISARVLFEGTLDPMTISDGPASATLEVMAESDAFALLRPVNSLFTDAEQQRLYPGDLFFQFTAAQAEQKLVWPAASWNRQ